MDNPDTMTESNIKAEIATLEDLVSSGDASAQQAQRVIALRRSLRQIADAKPEATRNVFVRNA